MIIEQKFRPALHDINATVAEQSLDNYLQSNPNWPLRFSELQQWQKNCETRKAELEQVKLASSNAQVKRLV